MTHVIRGFDKQDHTLIVEIVLPNVELAFLQQLFSVASEDPMYDSWPIDQRHFDVLATLAEITFDLSTCEYFLEYHGD